MTAFVIILITVFAAVGNVEIAANNSTACIDSQDLYEQLRIAPRILADNFTERDKCLSELRDSHDHKLEYKRKHSQCLIEVEDYITRMVRKMGLAKLLVNSIESCEDSARPQPSTSELFADNYVCKEARVLSGDLPRHLGQLVTCTGLLNDLKFRKGIVDREAQQLYSLHSTCRNNLSVSRITRESSP